MPALATLAVSWRDFGIWRQTALSGLLSADIAICWPFLRPPATTNAMIGWGCRSSGIRAQRLAAKHGRPCHLLEDGFLRSLGLGVSGTPPLSIVVDDIGIYYDATRPSRLEQLIADCTLSEQALELAGHGLGLLRDYRLSKYNHAPALKLPAKTSSQRVLVVDQTEGDVSVRLGGADHAAFARMLAAAQEEYPTAEIWVKTHPDVLAGKKRGYLPKVPAGVRLIAEGACPLSLLQQVDVVFTATSNMGFEALVAGCRVVCFGMPWYAGWGLTDDRHPDMATLKLRRHATRSLPELFHAAYLQYARYIQPETGQPGTFFDVAEWINLNRELRKQSSGTLWCIGMTLWKRAVVWPFLKNPDNRLKFIRSPQQLPAIFPADSKLVAWGIKPEIENAAKTLKLPLLRMEDGFLRSIGLGSNLLPPLSLVVDNLGLYYVPAPASGLLTLLNQLDIDVKQQQRAAKLREALIRQKISKYNVGGRILLAPAANGKVVILVPGQVEDDASIRAGTVEISSNLALLQSVRQQRPDAWIIYKPHPDVVSGNRIGQIPTTALEALADQVACDADISDCLDLADEVHTMTSQAGFEALMRRKIVHCYGRPFYSGWGLTCDQGPPADRQRRLSLDELVYGVLIAYPRYVLPHSMGYARVEAVVDHLQKLKTSTPKQAKLGSNWLGRQCRKGTGLIKTFL